MSYDSMVSSTSRGGTPAPKGLATPQKKKVNATQRRLTDRILSEWTTASGLTPEVHTICEPGVVTEIADAVEQGCPLSIALDLSGVPAESYREWSAAASRDETPYVWAVSIMKKAQATYIYTQVIELNLADGGAYKKYLEILKLRNGSEWGGEGLDLDETEFAAEFL